uniref:YqaJ viral recombinase domain-containing protein n=1 Tax=Strigamia maritima TaxID=126957 RepID=T1IZP2_STRMM
MKDLPALVYGRRMEDVAVAEYLRTMESSGKRVVAAVCGLYVHPTVSYLAATPDRTVEDLEEDPTEGILEVKCPKSMDKKTIIAACKTKTFCLEMTNSKACLKHNKTSTISKFSVNLL